MLDTRLSTENNPRFVYIKSLRQLNYNQPAGFAILPIEKRTTPISVEILGFTVQSADSMFQLASDLEHLPLNLERPSTYSPPRPLRDRRLVPLTMNNPA